MIDFDNDLYYFDLCNLSSSFGDISGSLFSLGFSNKGLIIDICFIGLVQDLYNWRKK